MDIRILISGSADLPWRLSYEEAVTAAGGGFHSAYLPEVTTDCDGLLLCGGGDMEPMSYGQENRACTDIDPKRDEVELALAHAYLAAGKPILAVCRGHQLLNVALGGTLIQDLPAAQRPFHTRAQEATEDRIHPIRAVDGSLIHKLYGEVFPVNSYHHQAVDLVGEGLKVTARSESGIVEVMEHKRLPILCTQYHPERMTGQHADPRLVDGREIFQWFLKTCGELKQR